MTYLYKQIKKLNLQKLNSEWKEIIRKLFNDNADYMLTNG